MWISYFANNRSNEMRSGKMITRTEATNTPKKTQKTARTTPAAQKNDEVLVRTKRPSNTTAPQTQKTARTTPAAQKNDEVLVRTKRPSNTPAPQTQKTARTTPATSARKSARPDQSNTSPPAEKVIGAAQTQLNGIKTTCNELRQKKYAYSRTANGIRSSLYDFIINEKYKILGYPSWTQCAKKEFDFGKSILSRQWLAAVLEVYWKVDLGTYTEWSVRPIAQASVSPELKTAVFAEATAKKKAKKTPGKFPTEDVMIEAIKTVFAKEVAKKLRKKKAAEAAEAAEAEEVVVVEDESDEAYFRALAKMGSTAPFKITRRVVRVLIEKFSIERMEGVINFLKKEIDRQKLQMTKSK